MDSWKNSSSGDRRLFQAISLILSSCPQILYFLFDTEYPKLRKPAEELLNASKCFSSAEYILIKLALDLWGGHQYTRISELLELDPGIFDLTFDAIKLLRPKPAKLSLLLEKNIDLIFQSQ